MAQMVKNLPAMQKTQVQSLNLEDPLEKEMATHSSILAWRIPWTEDSGWLLSVGPQRIGHERGTNIFTFNHSIEFIIYGVENEKKKANVHLFFF